MRPHSDDAQDAEVIDHPEGVVADGMFFPIDFDSLHARGEADEAAGRVFDHEEVMEWAHDYLMQRLEHRQLRGHA